MNIVWALDWNYIECCKTSIFSFIEKLDKQMAEDVKITVIMTGDKVRLIKQELDKMLDVLKLAMFNVPAYELVDMHEEADKMAFDKRLSPASSVRLKIPTFMDGKVLYVDCDTLFISYPKDLFELDMQGMDIAAKRDLDALWFYSDNSFESIGFNDRKSRINYFNAGVLLIDCEKASSGFAEADRLLQEKHYKHGDQDALNVVYRGDYSLLPNKFNHFVEMDESFWGFTDKPCLVHYTMNRNKPWLPDCTALDNKWCVRWFEVNRKLKDLLAVSSLQKS